MTETIRKISEKVQDEVYDLGKKLGVAGPKKRTAYDADTTSAGRNGKPTRNQAVVWDGPNKVSVADIGYPEMKDPQGNPIEHGVILKVVASGICGSDLHMYRGNIGNSKRGMTFGHEITGEVFEMGSGVERFDIGDIVSVPFNVSCGKCDNCREMKSSACLKANPAQPGGAYGYAGMGGWQGGQSEYVLVPWADYQLLKLPKEVAFKKITSLAFLSDIYPTAYNGALQAGVKAGSIVYVAGAGPVGLCCAQSCFLLGAAVVFISDRHPERLALAKQIGCKTIDLNKLSGGKSDSEAIMAEIERQLPAWKNGPHKIVDASVDCVGYECCGIGSEINKRVDEQVLNTCFQVTKAGGGVGIPGLYPQMDPSGPNSDNRTGVYHLKFGVAWEKGLKIGMGQCPVLDFNKDLLKTIIYDERIDFGKLLNVKLIPLSEAVNAYKSFDQNDAVKYVFDPHGMCSSSASSSSK